MNDKVSLTDNNVQVFENHVSLCPICGKSFCVQFRSEYKYKLRNKFSKKRYLCSYSCYKIAQTQLQNKD